MYLLQYTPLANMGFDEIVDLAAVVKARIGRGRLSATPPSATPPSVVVEQKGREEEKGKVMGRTKRLRCYVYLRRRPLKIVGFVGREWFWFCSQPYVKVGVGVLHRGIGQVKQNE